MRNSRHPRRGTVAVLTALCLVGILGFVALALDAVLLHLDRRVAQALVRLLGAQRNKK